MEQKNVFFLHYYFYTYKTIIYIWALDKTHLALVQ